jgi:hypothetical protein
VGRPAIAKISPAMTGYKLCKLAQRFFLPTAATTMAH